MSAKMFVRASCVALMVVLISAQAAEDTSTAGVRTVLRIYDECNRSVGGFTPCLKKKAITFIDRVAKFEKLSLGEGLFVVKSSDMNVKAVSENELESTLPRALEERDEALTNLLMERVAAFFNSRTIQINLPKLDSDELGRGLEEGRGKMKKMMGMMAMGFAMKMAAMVPIAIAGLFLLAGKALITSKIALLLAGIIALKKLVAQKNSGGGGHDSHGWQSSSGGGSGGWDRRSITPEAQKLAYSSYHP